MKKTLWAATVLMLASTALFAQAATTPAKKPAQKSAAAKQPVPVKKRPASSRQQLKSATNQVAAGIRAAEVALTPAELEVASRVQTGQMPCELGATVNLEADGKMPGYFDLTGNGFKYRMHVVPTTTGAGHGQCATGGGAPGPAGGGTPGDLHHPPGHRRREG